MSKFRPSLMVPGLRAMVRMAGLMVAATLAVTLMVRPTQDAIANGDTRTLSLYHTHTREKLEITFKRNGTFDPEALKKLNWFLRDWRRDEPTKMDPRLFDIVWAAYREVGGRQPIHVVSAYRAPETNSMLRRRSRGVAKFSQHTLGKAMDFFIPGVPIADVRVAGLRLQRGGVGFYPSSGAPFVHLDAGTVRMWPRMTRNQLAKVFPDGKTVHIPADGKKMPGYALAYAEIKSKGGAIRGERIAVASNAATSDEEDGGDGVAGDPSNPLAVLLAERQPKKARPIPSETVMTAAAEPVAETAPASAEPPIPEAETVADVPMPAARPTEIVVAEAEPVPDAEPGLRWQTGAQPVDLPPEQGNGGTPVEPPQFLQVAEASPPTLEARPAVITPGRAIQASAAAEAIGAVLPDVREGLPPTLAFAPDVPATLPAEEPPATGASFMVATRFERQDFGTVSRPVATARDVRLAGLVMPDLTSADTMIAKPDRIVPIKFGLAAYADLRPERFTGPAIRPLRVTVVGLGAPIVTGSIAGTP